MDSSGRSSALALRPRPDWALFLDIDGTILHLAETPDGVERSERVCRVLEAVLHCLRGAVALISGRRIDDLDRLFAPHTLPAAGLHGLERRDARGIVYAQAASETLDRLRLPLAHAARVNEGVILEDKGGALAVHYRRSPERAGEIRSLVDDLVRPFAGELHVIHGKLVSEIKPRHADKGTAIREFMGEAPFVGHVPVFIGDDATDEDGFACVNALDGHAIRVGSGADTIARYSLAGVEEVVDWLEAWPSMLRRDFRSVGR
ncbi:MAG: trehalose-phosphatase [Alphaproteobacteria bacterium]